MECPDISTVPILDLVIMRKQSKDYRDNEFVKCIDIELKKRSNHSFESQGKEE